MNIARRDIVPIMLTTNLVSLTMKKIVLILVLTLFSSTASAFLKDFSYNSDGSTLVCLNLGHLVKNRSTIFEYNKFWNVNAVEKIIFHIGDSKVLVSTYSTDDLIGEYVSEVFDIVNESDKPYIEFKNKLGVEVGKINRFTGDFYYLGGDYGPCKKIERLF